MSNKTKELSNKKVGAIIAEYNPFHNGHKYQIEKALEELELDCLIVIMSQDIVQRGEFANFDKYWRAEKALEMGADLVLGLPAIVSNQSAEFFASGAIEILSKLPVDYLIFGAEDDNLDELEKIAEILIEEPPEFQTSLRKFLKEGNSFALARSKALAETYPDLDVELVTKPNNILAIEYLKYIKKNNLDIKPHLIKRTGSNYHDKGHGPFASATGIRDFLETPDDTVYSKFVPYSLNELSAFHESFDKDDLFKTFMVRYLNLNEDELNNINHMSQELLNRLNKKIINAKDYKDIINILKTRNTNYTSVNRLLMNIILNITKDDLSKYYSNDYNPYLRVLGFNKNGQKILKETDLNSITTLKDRKILDENQNYFLEQDIKISKIRKLLSNNNLAQEEYKNKPVIKKTED